MAKSAFNFNAQEPGGGGLEVRNISADPAAMPDHLMPRRPQPGLSDRFAATYVSEPDNRRERGRSGRLLPRRDTPIRQAHGLVLTSATLPGCIGTLRRSQRAGVSGSWRPGLLRVSRRVRVLRRRLSAPGL